uniref:CUB domain-containing protein n=1 Tax=Acrobeloides nanus TaxID=290746 RepID=A0A914DFE6_9BILA
MATLLYRVFIFITFSCLSYQQSTTDAVSTTTTASSCSCYPQNEFFLNKTSYRSLDLYVTPNYMSCSKTRCLNCTYKVRTQFFFKEDAIQINYENQFFECDAQLLLTNCKNQRNMLEWMIDGDSDIDQFFSQEPELCISFTSKSYHGYCNFVESCNFHLSFRYVQRNSEITFHHLAIKHYTLQPTDPYSILNLNDVTEDYIGFSINTTGYNPLELWSAGVINDTDMKTFIYDATDMTNYAFTLLPWKKFDSYRSQTNSLTIAVPPLGGTRTYQFLWRIPTLHPANCNDTKNFDFLFPRNATFSKTIVASNFGSCLYSVLLDEASYFLPILHILQVNYVGNDAVQVKTPIGFNPNPILEFTLFEFTQDTAPYLADTYVYGNMINFVIPPLGQLSITFTGLSYSDRTNVDRTFDDRGVGVIQSPAYPIAFEEQDTTQLIRCNKGLASYTINIVAADISRTGYLKIFGDSRLVQDYQKGRVNETISLNATQVLIVFYAGPSGTRTNGLLINYEGRFISQSGTPATGGSTGTPTENPAGGSTGKTAIPTMKPTGSNGALSGFYGTLWTLGISLLLTYLKPMNNLNLSMLTCLLILIQCQYANGQTSSAATTATTTNPITSSPSPNCLCYSPNKFYLNSSDAFSKLSLYPTSIFGTGNNYVKSKQHKNKILPESRSGKYNGQENKNVFAKLKPNKNKHLPESRPKKTFLNQYKSQEKIKSNLIDHLDGEPQCSPCVSCNYSVHIDYYKPGDMIYLDFQVFNDNCTAYVSLTNCKNEISLLDHLQKWEFIGGNGGGSLRGLQFYTQETDLCLDVVTNSSSGMCDYSELNSGCYWELDMHYDVLGGFESEIGVMNFTLDNTTSVSTIDFDDIQYDQVGFSVTASTGTLELWSKSVWNESDVFILVYNAQNLTNYNTTLLSDKEEIKYQTLSTKQGFYAMQKPQDGYLGGTFHMLFRIPEVHAANCNTTNNFNFALPVNTSFSTSIASVNNGSCMYTILLPRETDEFYSGALPILHISEINYTGNLSVKVSSEFGFVKTNLLPDSTKRIDLFQVSQDSSTYWNDFMIYGNLINFVIPPGGSLNLVYDSKDLHQTNLNEDIVFADRKLGVIQSINYPFREYYTNQALAQHISCSKGVARFNMTINYADISPRGYLRIFGDDKVVKEYHTDCAGSNVIQNDVVSFDAKDVVIVFNLPKIGVPSKGLLINYEGNYIGMSF